MEMGNIKITKFHDMMETCDIELYVTELHHIMEKYIFPYCSRILHLRRLEPKLAKALQTVIEDSFFLSDMSHGIGLHEPGPHSEGFISYEENFERGWLYYSQVH